MKIRSSLLKKKKGKKVFTKIRSTFTAEIRFSPRNKNKKGLHRQNSKCDFNQNYVIPPKKKGLHLPWMSSRTKNLC